MRNTDWIFKDLQDGRVRGNNLRPQAQTTGNAARSSPPAARSARCTRRASSFRPPHPIRTSSSQVPADGTVDSLRGLLDQRHEARISVERLSIHTPDLDDVFFAVTGSHVTAALNGDPAPQGVPLS
jgi:hypothetical protein